MKLLTFQYDQTDSIGALLDDSTVLDLRAAALERGLASAQAPLAGDLKHLLERGDDGMQAVTTLLDDARRGLCRDSLRPRADVRLLAPVPNPSKIVAIGQNYRDHCAEQGVEPPERPIIFAKFPTSINGPGGRITWDPDLTSEVDYEAELAVVIGTTARNVAEADAFEYVAGYMNANDVSARDLQFGDRQWVRGKSLDTFCPTGPYLVTRDEVPDPHALAIRAILNGTVMQDSNTSNLIFPVPFLIAYASRAFTLLPGDILLTGTPPGVGVFRTPKVLLKPGDTITIDVERLGTLTNRVS